jgi:uncharacterized protein YjiS (DUF1127 family)
MRVSSSNPSFTPNFVAGSEHWLAGLGRAIVRRFNEWRKKRAILEELYRLDQWTLYDLRIHSCDFDSIANGTYQRVTASAPSGSPTEMPHEKPAPRLWPN